MGKRNRRPGRRIARAACIALAASMLVAALVPPVRAPGIRVVINEFLYDYAPGGHEWVELYNAESVGVSVDGWILSDEDGNDYAIPDIPDMPPGARIVVHFTNGTGVDETSFGQTVPGTLNLHAPFADVLEPEDQLSLYSGLPKTPTTIQDYVDWLSGGAVQLCSTPGHVSRQGDQSWDGGVALGAYAGQLHAVWASQDPNITTGTDVDIVGRAYGPGWGAYDEVNTPGDNDTQQDDVALAEHAGRLWSFWTVWTYPGGTPPGSYRLNASSHNGTRWSDESVVEDGPANATHEDPSAASYGGYLYVVWRRTEAGMNFVEDIAYKRWDGASWSPLQFVSDAGDAAQDSDPVALVYQNLLYVLWWRNDWNDPNATGIAYKTYDGAVWSGTQFALNGSGFGGTTDRSGRIAAEVFQGNLHLAWTEWQQASNQTGQFVYHRSFAGGAWGAVDMLSSDYANWTYDGEPDLEATADTLYAVWEHQRTIYNGNVTDSRQEIALRSFNGAVWSEQVNLTYTDTSYESGPDAESLGNAVYVAWEGYDSPGADADILYCRLQATASLGDDDNAVNAGIWTPGTYVDTLGIVQNLTVYRIADGNDTDAPADWSYADYVAPVALAGPDQVVPEDSLVLFDGSASFDNVAVVNHYWDADASDGLNWTFPDMVGPQVDWVFADPGDYTVTLRAEDAAGNWATDTVVVSAFDVVNSAPLVLDLAPAAASVYRRDPVDVFANATDPENPEDALSLQFQWRQRGGIQWRSTFFSPATYSGLPPAGYFTTTFTPGPTAPVEKYSLRARAQDLNGSWSQWFTVTDVLDVLSDLPIADAGPDLVVDEDAPLTLDGSGSWDNKGIADYAWEFGDGQSASGPSPIVTHVWAQPRTYTVRLTVTDTDGNTDDDTASVTVLDITPPVAAISGPASVEEDHGARFSGATSTDNVGVVLYAWDFGDGGSEAGSSPTALHAYDDPGTYTVTLTVSDAAGNSDTTTATIDVIDIITVNDDGDEDFTSIQPAVDFAPAGAKIFVHSGTYAEDVSLYKPVTLEGAGRDVTFVEGVGTVFNVTADDVTITGFTMRYADTCVYLDGVDGATVTYNRITYCDIGLYAYTTTNSFVAWNLFSYGAYGIIADHVDDDAYRWNEISYYEVYGAKSYDSELLNCFNWNRFHHNAVAYYYDPTLPLRPLLFDGNELWENDVGLRVKDADSLIVSNNTFEDNGVAVQLWNASPEVFRNTFAGAGVAVECDTSSTWFHDNDLTGMDAARVACVAADGFRFESNAMAAGDLAFTDSAVNSVDLPSGSVSFTGSTAMVVDLGATAVATYSWRLVVAVEDRLGAPLEGAQVFVEDSTGAAVASATTGADGRTPPMTIVSAVQTRGGTVARGPFTITAMKSGYASVATVDLTEDATVPLAILGYPPVEPPVTGGGGPSQPAPFPALAVLVLAGLLFVAGIGSGVLATSEVGRYHGWMLILPLFTRLKKDEVLDQPKRFQILGFVQGNPGAHFALIGQRLGLANGVLAYHLDILLREGHVIARSDGFKKRFYPSDTPLEVTQQFMMSDLQEKIIEIVAANAGIGQGTLATALGISRQVAAYHLEKLEKHDRVRRVGEGRHARYYPVDGGGGWVSSAPANGT